MKRTPPPTTPETPLPPTRDATFDAEIAAETAVRIFERFGRVTRALPTSQWPHEVRVQLAEFAADAVRAYASDEDIAQALATVQRPKVLAALCARRADGITTEEMLAAFAPMLAAQLEALRALTPHRMREEEEREQTEAARAAERDVARERDEAIRRERETAVRQRADERASAWGAARTGRL